MNNFRKINVLAGWAVFIISALLYLLTLEPTASLWDCGEFIATSYRLEVGHPPGAPLFMIMGRIFSLFAFGNTANVAFWVNAMSALASAFTILFLFWSITHLARKFIKAQEMTINEAYLVISCGIIGSLAYAVSDTFWFSAVEAEVYASSSLFTAVVFWAILKWENAANEKYANRWLLLIAYLMGLSIGVHLLNLLAIPAIVFVFYFKKYKATWKGMMAAFGISIVILGGIMYGLIQGIIILATQFELFFVNGLGLPFNSGVLFFGILALAVPAWGVFYSHKKKKIVLNTALLMYFMVVIGYSSYAMIVIRSIAEPPIAENKPGDVFSLGAYLNREQYGDRPLVYGPYYSAPATDQKEGKKHYSKEKNKYEVFSTDMEYVYDSKFCTFFPRMYSTSPNHIDGYKGWTSIKPKTISYTYPNGEKDVLEKPSFLSNIQYFISYQLGHMYFRYFLWNFAGRQNDAQGHGNNFKGNWLSGFNLIDNLRLGPQDTMPKAMKSNKARNIYFCLPLLLGLIGLFYQYINSRADLTVVFLLFFFTGIAIVMYLNQTPYEPRERDYAYAGSFYAFSIWIGLGVFSLYRFALKKLKPKIALITVSSICFVLVPLRMFSENLDDHNRSGRYTVRDWAINYLNSCAPNAILFTYGDNDTFPLWYVQEVEGIRTDVRVVNLSLLNSDWYISQMKKKAYLSAKLPITLAEQDYKQGVRDYLPVVERQTEYQNLEKMVDFMISDKNEEKIKSYEEFLNYLPTKKLSLPVDSVKVVKNGTVSKNLLSKIKIEKNLEWKFDRSYVSKAEIIVLDILAHNKWERPVYFAISIDTDGFMNLQEYLQLDGFAYRLVPYKTVANSQEFGNVDDEILYKNLMQKFTWGQMNQPDVNIDVFQRRNANMMGIVNVFNRLANKLLEAGKRDSAVKVLDNLQEIMPDCNFPKNEEWMPIVLAYYGAGAMEKADALLKKVAAYSGATLAYYCRLTNFYQPSAIYDAKVQYLNFVQLTEMTRTFKRTELLKAMDSQLKAISPIYQNQYGKYQTK